MVVTDQPAWSETQRLASALVEQLKAPLVQIALDAESGQERRLTDISATTGRLLYLIDAYLLSIEQEELPLESVSVSSVLYDVAQELDPLARQYNADLEISVDGKYGPVMANRAGLKAGLVTIGQSLLEADQTAKPRVVLSVYKHGNRIATGVFGQYPQLTAARFRRALRLYGSARQPLPQANAMNGAGLYIAHSLFETMATDLKVARHHNLNGFAASFLPSAQLQLI